MKNLILRASAFAFAAGLAGTMACGASSSSCGGSNINSNSAGTTLNMSCGAGTYLNNNQCVPIPTTGGTPAATPTSKVITN
jgi:hypothetical protein